MKQNIQTAKSETSLLTPKVSDATLRNWTRLNVSASGSRLKRRANKTQSERLFVPVEYLSDKSTLPLVEQAVAYIRNRHIPTDDALYSLGLNLLRGCPLAPATQALVHEFLTENAHPVDAFLADEFPYPRGERDFLGAVYQSLIAEGEKNSRGSYFTPAAIVEAMSHDLHIGPDTRILDPCCGSGAFLLHLPGICPENIEGIDLDATAVLLAKFNFFARFPQARIAPPIRQADFLAESASTFAENMQHFSQKAAALSAESAPLPAKSYDLIISNPPWGDKKKKPLRQMSFITSRESFSYFLVAAHSLLRRGGEVRFLLPESILNVRQHADIRRYLLEQKALRSVQFHGKIFSEVTTGCISLTLGRKEEAPQQITIRGRGTDYTVPRNDLSYGVHYVFPLLRAEDRAIIAAAERLRRQDLSRSHWALGIVTGDNRGKLHTEQLPGTEPIYTGKEVNRYRLSPPKYYIHYRREEMQQVADEALYRTRPKLVYKFIGKKLTFALDSSGSLLLNSANMLVPDVEHLSTNSLLALLNSELYQYLYLKLFGEVKVLQGNLIQLPLPFLSETDDHFLASCIERIEEPGMDQEIQHFIFQLYGLSPSLVTHLKQELYGRTEKKP